MPYIKAFEKRQKKGVSGVGYGGGNVSVGGNFSFMFLIEVLVIFALVVVVASLIGMTFSKKAIEASRENCEKFIKEQFPTELLELLQDNDDDDDDSGKKRSSKTTTLKRKWPRGEKGEHEDKTPRGIRGERGIQGIEGKEGPVDADGSPGKDGERGDRGPRGIQGERGPHGMEGKDGPAGADGSPRKDGERGPRGPRGIRGERGPQGVEGKEGPVGANGSPGKDGDRGLRGPRGIPGERGPQGVEGKEGPAGANGLPGKDGERGPRGLRGIRGKRGPQGVEGKEGPAGTNGSDGLPGKDGERGMRGPPAKRTLHNFKMKHARVKISWSGTNLNAATIECGYGNDSIPMDINVDNAVDIGTADIKNWYCVRIEKLNIINTKIGISVLFQVLNFTNDTLIISILCSEETVAESDILSNDKSELLNEPRLGRNSYRILRPICPFSPPSATSKGIVAVLHPGESCQFNPQFRTNTRKTSMLLLADSIHVKNSSLEWYASIKEETSCGRVKLPPTFEEVVFISGSWNGKISLSSEEKERAEQDHEKRAFVEALSNPTVRLQTPTKEELNKTVGCDTNYDLVRSVLHYLKTVDPHVTTDSTTFSHFFLEFLLSNVVKFLTGTGWEVDSLRDTKGCALIILTATARLAFSYASLNSGICNSFIRRKTLTADFSSLRINGQNIQQLIEGYRFNTP